MRLVGSVPLILRIRKCRGRVAIPQEKMLLSVVYFLVGREQTADYVVKVGLSCWILAEFC
jgi:hypothetical protein